MSIARPLRTALVAAVAWGAIAGCSDGGTVDEAATTTTRPEPTLDPTTTAPPTDEEAILAAVDGYWRTIRKAWDPPDSTLDGFDTYFTGEAKATSVAYVEKRQALDHGIRLPPTSSYSHSYSTVRIDGDGAHILDCSVDDSVLFVRSSGDVIDEAIVTDLWQTTLIVDAGVWKVSDNTILETWEGATSCDDRLQQQSSS
jgi:hypothetical protein